MALQSGVFKYPGRSDYCRIVNDDINIADPLYLATIPELPDRFEGLHNVSELLRDIEKMKLKEPAVGTLVQILKKHFKHRTIKEDHTVFMDTGKGYRSNYL